MKSRYLAIILAIVLFIPHTVLAKSEVVQLKWSELSAAITGREVTVVVSGNATVRGFVTEVRPEALFLTIHKTSDKRAYAPGDASILRGRVSEIRIKKISGHARLIGTVGAGAGLALGSLGWAISDSRVNVSTGTRVGQWSVITFGGAIGGYLLGRFIDTHETTIKVAEDN